MPTPTKITTQSTAWGITGSTETVIDRAPDGTLWWSQNEGDDAYFWYSRDQGTTWAYSGEDSDRDYLSTLYPRAFLIDADGYAHSVGRDDNTELSYSRGTSEHSGRAWDWRELEFTGANEALAPDGGIGMVAFRLGSGWKVFILYCTTHLSAGVYTNTLRLTRIGVSSSGSLTNERTDVIRTDTGVSYPYGSLAFQHTGDGRTATSTPHVYIATSVNTPTIASHTQDDLHLVKLTYEAGAWTVGAPLVLETGVDTTGRTMRASYDGTRVITAYGTRNRTTGTTSAAVHVAEWVEATGVVTRRDPPAWAGGYPLGVTSAVDPTTDDIYLVGYGETNGVPVWARYNRFANAWGAWTAIGTVSCGATPGRVSLKKYVAASAIEVVLETGSSAPYTDWYLKLTSINLAPTVPTLVAPSASSIADLGNQGAVFTWRFNDPDPGDTQGAWQMRRRVGAGAYSYYTSATGLWGGSAVWNTGTVQSVSFPPGVWTDGSVWSWSVNTQDASGLASGFAPDSLVTATVSPTVAVASPLGIYALDSSPIISWAYAGGNPQRTYQIRLFDLATYIGGGFDPAASTPMWDSGETSSVQARSVRSGASLLNGGTYRAYMRVSDSLALYSGWVFGEFLLVLTPAPPPVVEAVTETNWATRVPRVRLTLQGVTNHMSAEQAYNHADLTQWENDANTTIGSSATGGITASAKALMLTSTAAGDQRARTYPGVPVLDTTGAAALPARDFPVTVGKVYTALASFQAAVTPRNVRVTIRWYDPADMLLLTSQGVYLADMVGYPTQAYVTAAAPAGADRARVVLEVLAGTAGGEVHYADGIDFHPGLSQTYTPGGLTPQQTFTVTRYLPGDTVGTAMRFGQAVAADPSQHLILYDRDMPFGQPVTYTAQAVTVLSTGQALASDLSGSALAQVDSGTWAIRDPLDEAGELAALVIDHKTQQDEMSAAYHPAGRSLPLVETEGVQGEDGTVSVFVGTWADRVTLRSLLVRPSTMLLQSPSGDLWYVRFAARKRQALQAQSHQFDLDYNEVESP